MLLKAKLIFLLGLHLLTVNAQAQDKPRQLREYLSFSYPVDVRKSYSITDSIVAHAIGATLLRPGRDGGVTAALAKRWNVDRNGRFVDFQIQPSAKWSDGSPIQAREVAESFNGARAYLKDSLPSVFKTFSKIESVKPDTLRFYFAPGVEPKPAALGQFIAGACTVVKMIDGKASTKVTSGPYYVASANENELILKVNRHWMNYNPDMIDEIHLRRPKAAVTPELLLTDTWPNVVRLGFGALKSDLEKLPAGTERHQLNLNRIFGFHYAGRSALNVTRSLVTYLRGTLDTKKFANLLDGAKPANQIFPPGLPLHIDQGPKLKSISSGQFLKMWDKPSVRIGFYQDNLPNGIRLAIEQELKRVLPLPLEFVGTRNAGAVKAEHRKEFDLIFGTLGVDVDDIDQAMSYYIEADPPLFPSDPAGKFDFKTRLNATRKAPTHTIEDYRAIVNDVVEGGFYLPIAHYSSKVLGRPGFDFSHISQFGDLLPYPQVRMKKSVEHPIQAGVNEENQ